MGIRRKTYVAGVRDDVRVPFTEVVLDPPNDALPDGFRSGQIILSNQVRAFYLEKTPTHGYRLDWESFEGIGSVPWSQFGQPGDMN